VRAETRYNTANTVSGSDLTKPDCEVCSDDSPVGSSNKFAQSVLTERCHIVTTGSNIYSRRPEKVKYILIMHQYSPQKQNKCNKCGINLNFLEEGFIAFDEFVSFCMDEYTFPWL
jgi:hypothetical protein